MTEKVYEEFKNFTTCWLVKRHMNKMKWDLSLSKKIPAAFHNLQNYKSHYIFQAMGKYNFKTNVKR